MIRKTVRLFRRKRGDGIGKDTHYERVHRETWWLLWVLPLYSRETIVAHSM